jgi:adenylate kinase family enzyme
VPDEVVLELVKSLVDGFPRTLAQIDLFETAIAPPRAVVVLDVPNDVRADDTAEPVAHRLKVYRKQSYWVVERYGAQGKVIRISGDREIAPIRDDIIRELAKFWNLQRLRVWWWKVHQKAEIVKK